MQETLIEWAVAVVQANETTPYHSPCVYAVVTVCPSWLKHRGQDSATNLENDSISKASRAHNLTVDYYRRHIVRICAVPCLKNNQKNQTGAKGATLRPQPHWKCSEKNGHRFVLVANITFSFGSTRGR
jgi:hypothetical protein